MKAKTYIILLRGVNVGGKNKVSMTALKKCLEDLGYTDVTTYIASGNVLLTTTKKPSVVQSDVEKALPKKFHLDSELIKVLVLTNAEIKAIIDRKPKGFGEKPQRFHSDVIFLMDYKVSEAMKVFNPKEGIDTVLPGKNVIYSARLSAKRTQSRLSRIVGTPAYKHMTIRNWNTVTKLSTLIENKVEKDSE